MFGIAFAVSAGAAFLGVIGAGRQAIMLPPAEAMRPEPPAEYRSSIVERLGLAKFMSTTFRMALRNLERKPWQAFFTALGLARATGMPIVPRQMGDGTPSLLSNPLAVAQLQ